MPSLEELTVTLDRRQDLTFEQMEQAIGDMMSGVVADSTLSRFLLALKEKGESVEEVAGAASGLRWHMQTIASDRSNLLDTCGTGGDGSQTFNISTATALVTAAAGQPVAKHGNRSITSRSGSADVLRELGVNVEANLGQVETCLAELGICFCYAPLMHPSMRHVAAVRRSLGVPTIFNMLGPLCNPARAPFQLLGVGRPALRPLIAQALARLGTTQALIVCGRDGLDEVTLADETTVTRVSGPPSTLQELVWSPADFGVAQQSLDTIRVDGPQASAAMIRGVLAGDRGPARDIVLVNAAAALWLTGHAGTLAGARELAASAVDSGRADEVLRQLGELSHQ